MPTSIDNREGLESSLGAAAGASEPALAVPAEPASGLVAARFDQAQGFDPARIAEIVAGIEPTSLQPIIKRASDEFYEAMLTAVDYYLRENLEYNLGSHIQMLERENQRMRTELWEVDRALGGLPLGHANRLETITALDGKAVHHAELVNQLTYAVKLLGAFPTLNGTAQVDAMRSTLAHARGENL